MAGLDSLRCASAAPASGVMDYYKQSRKFMESPDNKIVTYNDLLTLWGIQDSLLQTYRTIFISMQSILVAFGSIMAQGESAIFPLIGISVLAMFALWFWVSICTARGQSVYLAQYLAMKAEAGDPVYEPLQILKHFQSGHYPEISKDPRFIALQGGLTRKKMERWLPTLFFAVWIFIWLITFA
ncbi:hypothetical protein Maes01_02827 [Microbulbifer aestuariivivens]|uniref:Uncharacterized protein n=1 Tax=Microbulbifer aestuariivivens TaxID=1908308 RepID=A0ABP9WUF9_9GAMM